MVTARQRGPGFMRQVDAKLDRVIDDLGDIKVRLTNVEENSLPSSAAWTAWTCASNGSSAVRILWKPAPNTRLQTASQTIPGDDKIGNIAGRETGQKAERQSRRIDAQTEDGILRPGGEGSPFTET